MNEFNDLIPMDVLTAQIKAGWGSIPQPLIPPNWRELKPPHIVDEDDPQVIKRKLKYQERKEREAKRRAEYVANGFTKTLRKKKWKQREIAGGC